MEAMASPPGAVDVTDSDVTPGRYYRLTGGFAPAPHDIMDEAGAHLQSAAHHVLYRIVRHILGWQRESATLPVSQLRAETGLSKQGVLNAIAEIKMLNLIEVKQVGTGRAMRSEFRLLAPTEWRLPPGVTRVRAKNGQLSVPISKSAKNGQLSRPIQAKNGQLSVPMPEKNGQLSVPLINKTIRSIKKSSKQTPSTAGAVADVSVKKSRSRPIGADEAAYIKAIFDGVEPLRRKPDGAEFLVERAMVRSFYALPKPPTPEQVIELYEIELTDPGYASRPLHINHLGKLMGAWLANSKNFRAGIERKNKAVRGDYDQKAPAARPGAAAPVFTPSTFN